MTFTDASSSIAATQAFYSSWHAPYYGGATCPVDDAPTPDWTRGY